MNKSFEETISFWATSLGGCGSESNGEVTRKFWTRRAGRPKLICLAFEAVKGTLKKSPHPLSCHN